jgi:broad specificity phosphatase PhoE
MTKVFLIRTGQTRANLDGKLSNLSAMTENGIEQVYKVRNLLVGYNIAAIFSSAIDSAVKTAEIIAEPRALKVTRCEDFNEINLGLWDGMTKEEIAEQFGPAWQAFNDRPTEGARLIPSGETFIEVRERVLPKLNALVSQFDGKMLCIVAHGFVNRVVICSLLGLDLSNVWKFDQFNTAINMFELSSNRVKFQAINCIGHLYDARSLR